MNMYLCINIILFRMCVFDIALTFPNNQTRNFEKFNNRVFPA